MKSYSDIGEYIANFEGETKKRLELVRKTIKAIVPSEVTEKISYGIPTYYLNGNLVHFAGYKNHIGLYPGSVPIKEFEKELSGYKTSKGTVQFSHGKPLPLELIKNIVAVCVERNQAKKREA